MARGRRERDASISGDDRRPAVVQLIHHPVIRHRIFLGNTGGRVDINERSFGLFWGVICISALCGLKTAKNKIDSNSRNQTGIQEKSEKWQKKRCKSGARILERKKSGRIQAVAVENGGRKNQALAILNSSMGWGKIINWRLEWVVLTSDTVSITQRSSDKNASENNSNAVIDPKA